MFKLLNFVIPIDLYILLIFILSFNLSCNKEDLENYKDPHPGNTATETYCVKMSDALSHMPILDFTISAIGVDQNGFQIGYFGASDSLGKFCFDVNVGETLLELSASANNYISICQLPASILSHDMSWVLTPASFIKFHIKNSQLNNQDNIKIEYLSISCNHNQTLNIDGLLVDTTIYVHTWDGDRTITWLSSGNNITYTDTLSFTIAQPRDTALIDIIY